MDDERKPWTLMVTNEQRRCIKELFRQKNWVLTETAKSSPCGITSLEKNILIEHRVNLVEWIHPTEIFWSSIISKGMLSTDHVERIKTKTTRKEKVADLLDILPSRGRDAYTNFCDVLTGTGHEIVAQYLNSLRDQPSQLLQPINIVQTIPGTVRIRGVTVLRSNLYIARRNSKLIEAYDIQTFRRVDDLDVSGVCDMSDMTSSVVDECLYLAQISNVACIFQVFPDGRTTTQECDGYDPYKISVTPNNNILVTCDRTLRIIELKFGCGDILHQINLPEGMSEPGRSIRLSEDELLVIDGYYGSEQYLHRVCIVDQNSDVLRAYAGPTSPSTACLLNRPSDVLVLPRIGILISDMENDRLLLLNFELRLEEELLTRDKHGTVRPVRLCMCQRTGQLFVALEGGSLLVFQMFNVDS